MLNIILVTGLSHEYVQFEKWIPIRDEFRYYLLVKAKDFLSYEESLGSRKDIHLIKISNWYNSGEIENFIYNFSKSNLIDKLISIREEEVLRISKIRKALNISGIYPSSALLYRNKHKMKEFIRNNGVSVTKDAIVESFFDALAFIQDTNYIFPYILKPIDGSGSKNTFVVESLEDLQDLDYFCFKNSIIEVFVHGDVYHIDILFTQNTLRYISAARYINTPLEFQNGKATASMFLSKDNPESKNMVEYGKKICSLMPKPDNCIIHLETFYTDHGIIFNEIAIRFGGGKILSTINREFKLNLLAEYIKAECDIPFRKDKEFDWEKPRGFILFTPKPGILQKIPDKIPGNDIDNYTVYATVGDTYSVANSSVFAVASLELHGDTNDLLKKRILDIEEWFNKKIKYVSLL